MDVGLLGQVLIATRLVTGSAVKRVPSTVEETGAAVVMRILVYVNSVERYVRWGERVYRAPMAPLRAASRETVFATGCVGVLFGTATGVLFPTFWRLVSDAILMQDLLVLKKVEDFPRARCNTKKTVGVVVEVVNESGLAGA